MTIAMLMDFNGATVQQYDRVLSRLNLKGKTAPGGLFHVVGATETGLRVVDVWRSEEDFDRFYDRSLRSALTEAGIDPPQISVWPVHNTLTPNGPVHLQPAQRWA